MVSTPGLGPLPAIFEQLYQSQFAWKMDTSSQ